LGFFKSYLIIALFSGEPIGYVVQYRRITEPHTIDTSLNDATAEENELLFDESGDHDEQTVDSWLEKRVSGARQQTFVLGELEPASNYEFRLAAVNTYGRGRFTGPPPVSAATYEGGMLHIFIFLCGIIRNFLFYEFKSILRV
jgi:hypothetical protein